MEPSVDTTFPASSSSELNPARGPADGWGDTPTWVAHVEKA